MNNQVLRHPVFQKSRYEKSRQYCAICATEIASATAAGNLDWGCNCNDWARCCEKCHNENHSPDTCWNYDNDTYGSD
jgi:hypothetical protein